MSEKPTILLCDDHVVSLRFSRTILSQLDFEVTASTDPKEILELASEMDVDLLVADFQMPDMTGIELARGLRALPHINDELPVLIISAGERQQLREQCELNRIDAMLTKPVRAEDIRKVVHSLLASSQTRRQAEVSEPEPEPESTGLSLEADALLNNELIKELMSELSPRVIQLMLGNLEAEFGGQVDELESVLVRGDAERVRAIAHKLKGGLSQMGMRAGSKTAETLQHMGRDGALEGGLELVPKLREQYHASREAIIANYLAEG